MKVQLASCPGLPTGDGDDDALIGALAEVGVDAFWSSWDSGAAADLVVLRATWDYTERLPEFLAWCESVPALANPLPVVRWNTDKAYLVELASAGVAVVPTSVVRPGDTVDWPAGEFVVKPSVGAGSRGAARFAAGEFSAAAEHLLELDAPALVQPYQSRVDGQGETALVFLGGVYSHAFTKGAMLGDNLEKDDSGLYVLERLSPAQPDAARRRLAEDTLDAATGLLGIGRADLLYARVDVVPGEDDRPLLLELELAEPSLGFRQTDPAAPLRFASAVRAYARNAY